MLQIDQMILFAADEWWQIVGGIIFMVLYGLQHLLTGKQDAKQVKPKKVRPARKPPVKPVAQAQPADQADPLRAEVDAFLRQAEGKKQRGAEAPRDRPRVPIAREQRPRPVDQQRRPARSTQAPRKRKRTLESETVPVEIVDPRQEEVGQHVARHLSKKRVTEGAEHLGEEVALADDRIEMRLEEKFEHRLGSLEHKEQQVQERESSIAEELRQLLSQPQGMRQLIIANEILRRPEERW